MLLSCCGTNPAFRAPVESQSDSFGSRGDVPVAVNPDPNLFCDGAHHDEPAAAEPMKFARIGKLGDQLPDAIRQPSDIHRTIKAHYEDFKACYEKALQQDPRAHGVVRAQLVIEPDGSTTDVCILSSSINNAQALSCLIARYSKLSFDRADKKVTVVYPLQFDPG
ncbi:MAG TPA: AgmX/PglI C-terminal domain-containing protein [Polyangiaceae bacterium]|nr:AgmX/PglI C-terminal domain-containing protein [Polyangiaceae bacterium]